MTEFAFKRDIFCLTVIIDDSVFGVTVGIVPSSSSCELLRLSSPLKRKGNFHKFGSKPMKPRKRKTLGKNMSRLIVGGDELDQQITLEDPFTHKMVIYIIVFCTGMEDMIGTMARALTLSHQSNGG